MDDTFEDQYKTFEGFLESFSPAEAVKRLERLHVPKDVLDAIRDRHEREVRRIVEMEEPRTVVRDNWQTWYVGPREGDPCWPAVADILRGQGWPEGNVESLDDSSTRIMSLLEHPKVRDFQTMGLVVGYVQSGKTTNFTSVMAKAADRGYKLFIVLAGIHNSLRRQTQARLVQQLVQPNPALWTQLTELDSDFTPSANPASYFGGKNKTHVLCVIKKNPTVLRKFSKWLGDAQQYLKGCPTLIIDDEADQASVGTKTINPLILDIMGKLPRSAYVGYTATPFANVLIDPVAKDLYPQDFIVNLPKPDGHFGTEVLFGRHALEGEDPEHVFDGYDMIRTVPDEDVPCVRPQKKADIEGFEPVITETLQTSVEYFWMVTAARRIRDTGNKHNTMLIHTSVNSGVQDSFRRPLEHLQKTALEKVQAGDAGYQDRLRELWKKETARVPAGDFGEEPVPFDQVWALLPSVLRSCQVILDNYKSNERLDYDNGPVTAIAVGGNTLSRGLTLEGLSVSYFVRAASAYDTLLQMGRWFGFRNGYADLPRIWMTDGLCSDFRHIATVEAEMRQDIDRYLVTDETPTTFAVRLRTHPTMQVTQAAKRKSAVTAAASYAGTRVQTRYFHTNTEWLGRNSDAARGLVRAAAGSASSAEKLKAGKYLFRNVPYEHVSAFLDDYAFHADAKEFGAMPEYIRRRVARNSLRRWNVAVIGSGRQGPTFSFAPDIEVGLNTRTRFGRQVGPDFADIKTLMSMRDSGIDLSVDVSGSEWQWPDITKVRKQELPDTGLLLLYPIDKDSRPTEERIKRTTSTPRMPLDAEAHVVGAAFVFPEVTHGDVAAPTYISADLSGLSSDREGLIEGEDDQVTEMESESA